MVVTTSCAPRQALRKPAIPPQIAPASMLASSIVGINTQLGHEVNVRPTTSAAIAPTANWPAAPMLKRPARKAIATEILAKMSGETLTRVSEIFDREPYEPVKRAP